MASRLGPLGHPDVIFYIAGKAQDGPWYDMRAVRQFNRRIVETMGYPHVRSYQAIMRFQIGYESVCRDILIAAEVAAKVLGELPRLLRICRPTSDCMAEANQ